MSNSGSFDRNVALFIETPNGWAVSVNGKEAPIELAVVARILRSAGYKVERPRDNESLPFDHGETEEGTE